MTTEITKNRTSHFVPEIRDERRLVFYPAIFNTSAVITEQGETFVEVIRPGTFQRTLSDPTAEVVASVEHDPQKVFARRSRGLLLQEDARGLFASCYLEPNALNDSILKAVRSGEITGASFQMIDVANGRKRTMASGPNELPTIEVTDVRLIDVTLSAGSQIYKTTTVSVRTAGIDHTLLRYRLLKARRCTAPS